MQLLSGKSIILYFPPKETAGFATFCVNTPRRLPCPPANSIAIISFFTMISPLAALFVPYISFLDGDSIITYFLEDVNKLFILSIPILCIF